MANYKLNKSQKQAIEYFDGPLIIVAGAGTGKTTVITEKITHILKNKLATPEEILALTFTEKAAAEMFERVDSSMEIGYVDLQISTFHAFCQKILEEYGLDIGLGHNFKLITETESWLLMRKNLDKFNLDYYRPMGNPASHLHALISHFQKSKDELITPAEYVQYAEDMFANKDSAEGEDVSKFNELANAYHTYNQILLDNNALDFADLIFYTVKLFKERPAILKQLQKKYKYILVDEFQDVNWSQYQLVQMLSRAGSQLTVVGDDDQSIYAFRGASVSNILRFKDDFPKAKEIVLNENYRSQQKILDLAYKLIQNNNPDRLEVKLNVNKKLISGPNFPKLAPKDPSEQCVVHIHAATLDEEVNNVIKTIVQIKETDSEAAWKDFAILVRANNHSEPFISALEKAGIPYEFLAASGLYRQPLVLDCLNFLKLLDNYRESTALFRLLLLPVWKMDDHDLQKITYFAKRKAVSLYETLKQSEQYSLSPDGTLSAQKILQVIQKGMQNSKTEKPTTVLFHFLQDSGMLEYLTKEELKQNKEVIRQIYQLKEFFEYVRDFEHGTPHATVMNFLEHFNYVMDSGDPGGMYQASDNTDAVHIITVHKSKGLEFKYVFVVNLVEDRFPGRRRGEAIPIPQGLIKEKLPEGDNHYQEERRLMYVAMTRAKDRLFLTSADDYGGVKNKKISRFLPELGFTVLEKPEKTKGDSMISVPQKLEDKAELIYEVPKVFSFSQIKAYETCPYQYKLSHILHIPTKGSASFSFGKSMHNAMQKFYERLKELNQATQTSLFGESQTGELSANGVKAPSLDELLAFYDQSWIDDWYLDAKQKEEYYKTGKDILRAFYNTEKEHWTVPISLESGFKVKIGDYLLRGQIDRLDQTIDGSLEIIDYKTGKGKEKLEAGDKDQLLIYQIAINQLPEYKNSGAAPTLSYVYLNNYINLSDNVKISFLGADKEIEKLKEKVIRTIEEIKSGNFQATPSPQVCKNCDFRNICQFRA